MTGSQQVVTVFGDSHSKFFHPTPLQYQRMGVGTPLPYRINGSHIRGAAVSGFRQQESTLNVKEKIIAALTDARYMILAFGQVDLELGYYFRNAIKGESYSPEAYTDWLIGIYSSFVNGLQNDRCELALKGANLTVLDPAPFAARYVSKIAREGTKLTIAEASKLVRPFILSETDQNSMHLRFNEMIRDLAINLGIRYFDLNDDIRDLTEDQPRVADVYRPGPFDHHLTDSLPVRRLHYVRAGEVFGLR